MSFVAPIVEKFVHDGAQRHGIEDCSLWTIEVRAVFAMAYKVRSDCLGKKLSLLPMGCFNRSLVEQKANEGLSSQLTFGH